MKVTYVRIKPIIFWDRQANFLRIENVYIVLNEEARVHWELVDLIEQAIPGVETQRHTVFASDVAIMPKEVYDTWGNDDSFVISWLVQQLNLEIIPNVD